MSGSSAPIHASTEGSFPDAMDDESEQMHVDSLGVNVTNNRSLKNSLPVIEHAGSSGKGFPYALENWPSPGDVWTWRVGKRSTRNGFWQDRLVQLPNSLRSSTGKMSFRSRVSLEQYVQETFPDADVDAFFDSFSWKIPCTHAAKDNAGASLKIIKSNGCLKSTLAVLPGDCKANNEMCNIKAKTNSSLTPANCTMCCTEPDFCPYCCCILCSKTIDWTYEGCNFIKCEAPIDEKFICGHVAHIECALRAYLAGKVGGIIDLDAQYCCRCCDNKTDLIFQVKKIIKVCESIDNRDDMGKVLNLGFCMLRGSEKEKAKELRNHIAMLMEKEYILSRNPLVNIMDEAAQFDFKNLPTRSIKLFADVQRSSDKHIKEVRELVEYQKRLLKAAEEIERANVRLRLEKDEQAARIRELEANSVSSTDQVRAELERTVVKETVDKVKAAVEVAYKKADEAKTKQHDKIKKLWKKIDNREALMTSLWEEVRVWRDEKHAYQEEVYKLRRDLKLQEDKSAVLQSKLDNAERILSAANQTLVDTYFHCWQERGLEWMEDYPEIMAGIHSRLVKEATSQLGEGEALDRTQIDRRFTNDELKVIETGYNRLSEEEARRERDREKKRRAMITIPLPATRGTTSKQKKVSSSK